MIHSARPTTVANNDCGLAEWININEYTHNPNITLSFHKLVALVLLVAGQDILQDCTSWKSVAIYLVFFDSLRFFVIFQDFFRGKFLILLEVWNRQKPVKKPWKTGKPQQLLTNVFSLV